MSTRIVTLLTDFGLSDSYVGQMRVAMLSIAPQLSLVDLTHAIEPQNILHGACVLEDAVEVCPAGTIHVVIIDPGVGSARRPIAAEIGDWIFVAPDNGVLTAVLDRWPCQRVVTLSNARYRRSIQSATFHGRDLFGPAAAYLAMGTPLTELGPILSDPLQRITLPQPQSCQEGVAGEVLWSDHYGNLVTNLRRTHIRRQDCIRWETGQTMRLVTCYAEGAAGEIVALFGSSGRLEIAQCRGSARQALSAQPGMRVWAGQGPVNDANT